MIPTMSKVAVVTGGSSGIGLAAARALARDGAAVVLCARRTTALGAAVRDIEASGGRALAVTADVTSEADMNAVVGRALEAFGRLDVMICNAGFGYYGSVEQTPPDIMRRMMDVNFTGTFLGARAALPIFRRQGAGHLIFISSIVGRRGVAFMSGYTATKAAQKGFAEALRAELLDTGIHVSCVFPISTETEFHETITRDFGYRFSRIGPVQTAEQVADAIVACVRQPRAEVYPHAKSRALAVLGVLAPAFTDRLVRRFGRRRDETAPEPAAHEG